MTTVAFTGPATVRGAHIVRENLVRLAESQGLRVVTSVGRGTDYLVTSTPQSGSRKNTAAQRCGTKLITPHEFIQMCGGKIELRLKDLV